MRTGAFLRAHCARTGEHAPRAIGAPKKGVTKAAILFFILSVLDVRCPGAICAMKMPDGSEVAYGICIESSAENSLMDV